MSDNDFGKFALPVGLALCVAPQVAMDIAAYFKLPSSKVVHVKVRRRRSCALSPSCTRAVTLVVCSSVC